jgi:hypothetical protein
MIFLPADHYCRTLVIIFAAKSSTSKRTHVPCLQMLESSHKILIGVREGLSSHRRTVESSVSAQSKYGHKYGPADEQVETDEIYACKCVSVCA